MLIDLIIRLYDINSDLDEAMDEAMDDLIDEWHESNQNLLTISEFLDIDKEEYVAWVKNTNYLYDIKDSYRYWFDKDKSVIYDVITDEDVCLYFDIKNRNLILKLLNKNDN